MPTGRFALLLALGGAVVLLAPADVAWLWWVVWNLGVASLALGDWAAGPHVRDITVTVAVKGHWVRGEAQPVQLHVTNGGRRNLALRVRQDVPLELGGPAAQVVLQLTPRATGEAMYTVVSRERGDYSLGAVHGRWPGRFGLVVLRGIWAGEQPVRVYAPLYLDSGPAVAARHVQTPSRGQAQVRAVGVRTEFESLREYREGDDARAVNWRATARRGYPVVNQYRDERSQQVMLVLDAGRLMVPEYQGIPRFEYALSAALQLGRLAAEREDRVGMLLLGQKVEAYLSPGRGQAQVSRIAEAAYRVKPQMVEPDYPAAFARLSGSLKRRSLVLFFTDLVAPGVSATLVNHLALLVPRHVVTVLAISDPTLTQLATGEATSVKAAYSQAAADWVLAERAAAKAPVLQLGIPVIDAAPHQLSTVAISRYLAVKQQGRL